MKHSHKHRIRGSDDHMGKVFYTVVLAEDEKAREEFLAFAREQERFAGMTNDQFRKLSLR
jgi:hypothetical protein